MNSYKLLHYFLDCRPSADLLFIVDSSESQTKYLDDQKAFIRNITMRLPIGPDEFRVAIITYSFDGDIFFDFQKHKNLSSLLLSIENIHEQRGSTFTVSALKMARQVCFFLNISLKVENIKLNCFKLLKKSSTV